MSLDPEVIDKLNSSLSSLGEVAKELLSYTGKKVKEVGAEAEKKARNISRIAKLSSERNDVEKKLAKDYEELGRYFYEQNENDIPNEYAAFFDQIRLSAESLERADEELRSQRGSFSGSAPTETAEVSFEERISRIEEEMAAEGNAKEETPDFVFTGKEEISKTSFYNPSSDLPEDEINADKTDEDAALDHGKEKPDEPQADFFFTDRDEDPKSVFYDPDRADKE